MALTGMFGDSYTVIDNIQLKVAKKEGVTSRGVSFDVLTYEDSSKAKLINHSYVVKNVDEIEVAEAKKILNSSPFEGTFSEEDGLYIYNDMLLKKDEDGITQHNPVGVSPFLVKCEDNWFFSRDGNVFPAIREDYWLEDDFNALFSVSELDKEGSNLVKSCYLLLKTFSGFNQLEDD